jgi:hypothetical protein
VVEYVYDALFVQEFTATFYCIAVVTKYDGAGVTGVTD